VTFDGPVDPSEAADPGNYAVITRLGEHIPIESATYDPATNSVTLIPARRLNVHHHFRLSIVLPCPNDVAGETVIIPFGGRESLIGFMNHHGQFISVKNGRVVRANQQGRERPPMRIHHISVVPPEGSSLSRSPHRPKHWTRG
jgi:hypothetical protein